MIELEEVEKYTYHLGSETAVVKKLNGDKYLVVFSVSKDLTHYTGCTSPRELIRRMMEFLRKRPMYLSVKTMTKKQLYEHLSKPDIEARPVSN